MLREKLALIQGLAAPLILSCAALLPFASAQAFQNIIVSPGFIQFGSMKVGGSSGYSVMVSNTGDETIYNLSIFAYGDRSEFYTTNYCTMLAPHASCSIHIFFNPTRVGRFSADIDVAAGIAHGNIHAYGEGVQ
jgi:hypothetical protein